MEKWLLVALGGAFGAVARYSISLIPIKTEFPFLTLLTNLAGALLIGFLAGLGEKNALGQPWILFWKTGVCGGFTTFSTFSLEAWTLLDGGKRMLGGVYIVSSVALCLLGVITGQWCARRLLHA